MAAFSVGTSILGGFQESEAMKQEAMNLEYQADAERLRGKQVSAARRGELVDALSTIGALRAGSGASLVGGSATAIRRGIRESAKVNENNEVLSSKFQETALRNQAAGKRRAAPFRILAGLGRGASTLAPHMPSGG